MRLWGPARPSIATFAPCPWAVAPVPAAPCRLGGRGTGQRGRRARGGARARGDGTRDRARMVPGSARRGCSGRAAARRGSRNGPRSLCAEEAPPQCGAAAPVRAPRVVTPCGSAAASGERPWGGAGLPAGRWGWRQGVKEGGRGGGSRRGDFLLLLSGSSKQLLRWSGRHGWAPSPPAQRWAAPRPESPHAAQATRASPLALDRKSVV